ncbi:hypothetical protein [Nocardia australiensis]|uniref:hypothetical protein n=1 Tax=Nocardia australiensis TaxID=2887191 RepID=UPI001D13F6CE|nr:hypothetical protein [Nocardia australiensis]
MAVPVIVDVTIIQATIALLCWPTVMTGSGSSVSWLLGLRFRSVATSLTLWCLVMVWVLLSWR